MVEGLLHDHPPGGEVTVQAVADVVRAVQNHVDEGNLWHVKGRPQIPISEEQLVTLLELHFPNVLTWQICYRFPQEQSGGGLSNTGCKRRLASL